MQSTSKERQPSALSSGILAAIGSNFISFPALFGKDYQGFLVTNKPEPRNIVSHGFTRREWDPVNEIIRNKHEDYVVEGTMLLNGVGEIRYEVWVRRFFWRTDPECDMHFAVQMKMFCSEGTVVQRCEYHPHHDGTATVTTSSGSSERFASLMGGFEED